MWERAGSMTHLKKAGSRWRFYAVLAFYVVLLMAFAQAPAWPQDLAAAPASDASGKHCAAIGFTIDLHVRNVRKGSGVITVDVHDGDPAGFLNNHGLVKRVRTAATQGVTHLCIPVDSEGTYALAVYHDRDADHVFDKNWIGLPTEPYGISNDPPMRFGPPPHEAAAFVVNGPGVPVTVTLRGG